MADACAISTLDMASTKQGMDPVSRSDCTKDFRDAMALRRAWGSLSESFKSSWRIFKLNLDRVVEEEEETEEYGFVI